MTKEKKSTKKRLRIRPLTVIVALLALLYITLSVIPLNLTPWKDDISKAASSGINGTITMDEVWIYLAPHPRVKIINLTLKDEKEVILNAKNMRVTVSLFPLILKKLNIRELIFENLELRARRDTKGIINFQRLSKKKTFTLKLSSLQLKNSKIDFFDDMAGGGKHHEVSNANAFFDVSADGLKYQSSGKILPKTSFQISGSAVKDNNFWSLTGNLNLDNLEVGRFTPYLKAVKIKDAKTTGTLTLKTEYNFTGKNPSGNKNFLEAVLSGEGQVKGHATSKDFVLKMPSLFSKEINSANANTDLELTWKDKEVFFALKDTTLEIENHTINGTLTMESSEKAQASFELNLKTTPIKASYIKDLIRPKALPSGFKKIVEIRKPVTGIVIIKKLSFGTGGGVLNTLSLDARLSDFSFSNPNLKQPVTGISGRLSAHGGNLYVNNLRGKYGSSKVENISGEIRNVSKSPFYSATLKATLDTGEAFDEFRKRFKSKTLRGALISGKADVELSIKGGGEDDAPFLITSSLDITGSEFFYKKSLRKTNGQVLRL
ncbi:MAG: DUF748 domain-containing protein, partial [Deltaproteobacteria bacterium]|nr:DUF748 domain-containing protein [Deltaproteobacteria bacterium]